MSDFDDILNNTEEPEATQAQEQAHEAPEAEPQEEAAPPEPVEATSEPEKEPEKTEHMVPVRVVQELREELRSLKEQRQQQPPREAPKIPDVFEDQDGFTKHIDSRLRDATMEVKIGMSRFMAEREFGAEAVQEAIDFFERPENHAQSWQLMDKPSPIHAAVEYVKAQKVAQEIGSDPAAFRAKLEAEIRDSIKAEMAAEQAKQMAAKAPPSLANVNGGSGGKADPGWNGPVDLESLIG